MTAYYQTPSIKEAKRLKKLGFKYTKSNNIYEFEDSKELKSAQCQK